MSAVECVYEVRGSGPSILMIHGTGGRGSMWNQIVNGLAQDFTCVSYDMRGHGDSPVPPTPCYLDDMVADLEALREKLGIDKAHVVGHSVGGTIGPSYTRAYPDRVISLGILSGAACRAAEDREKILAVITRMEETGVAPVLKTLAQRWFTDEFAVTHPEATQSRLDNVSQTPAEVFTSTLRIYAENEMEPWLEEILVPTLVLTGECDISANPRINRLMAERLPNAELVILDKLRHSLLIEAPDQLVPILHDFFTRHSQGSSG